MFHVLSPQANKSELEGKDKEFKFLKTNKLHDEYNDNNRYKPGKVSDNINTLVNLLFFIIVLNIQYSTLSSPLVNLEKSWSLKISFNKKIYIKKYALEFTVNYILLFFPL